MRSSTAAGGFPMDIGDPGTEGPAGEASPDRDGEPHPRIAYKWVALSVTTLGAAMSAIDSSIVILALPTIMTDLRSDLVTMIWVLMGYILMSTVFLVLFGRLADMFGRVRLYNPASRSSRSGPSCAPWPAAAAQLVLFRLVQGMGGAMLMANGMAIITEAFPRGRTRPRDGHQLRSRGPSGGVVGPIVGGRSSWPSSRGAGSSSSTCRSGIVGTAWGYLALHEISQPRRGERLDLRGMAPVLGRPLVPAVRPLRRVFVGLDSRPRPSPSCGRVRGARGAVRVLRAPPRAALHRAVALPVADLRLRHCGRRACRA